MANQHVSAHPAPARRGVFGSRIFGRYIINNRFQFKFSLIVFSFLAVATLTIWLLGRFAVGQIIETGLVTSHEGIAQLTILNSLVLKISLLALSITFGLSLLFSHYIAGPVYRFEKTLEAMRDGDLSGHVRLRKHDEFKGTADMFNQSLASLRVRIQKEREAVHIANDKIRKIADRLKQEGKASEAADLEHILVDLDNTPPQIKF